MEYGNRVTAMSALALLQQKPIIVDVGKQPTPTRDITFDFLVGMFTMAGVLLLAALEVAERNHEISSDELDRAEKEMEKITHEHVEKIDKALARKEHELLEV